MPQFTREDRELIRDDCDMEELFKVLGIKKGGDHCTKIYHCPWPENHSKNDTHPSFSVLSRQKKWKCFVCTKNPDPKKAKAGAPCQGDLFDLVMAIKKVPFYDAVLFVKELNEVVAKKKKDLGRPDYSANQRAIVRDSIRDYKLFSGFYSLLWSTGKSVTQAPEAFKVFNKIGISNQTLDALEFRFLDNIDHTVAVLRNKYDLSDMKEAGIFEHLSEAFQLQNYPLVLPFKVGDTFKSLQGWKLNELNFKNLRNDYFVLLNEKLLLKHYPAGATVVLLQDVIDCMSYIELYKNPGEIPVAKGSTKSTFDLEWLEYCSGKRVKLVPKTRNIDEAIEMKNELLKNRIADVELVTLYNTEKVNSVNELLCKNRKVG